MAILLMLTDRDIVWRCARGFAFALPAFLLLAYCSGMQLRWAWLQATLCTLLVGFNAHELRGRR